MQKLCTDSTFDHIIVNVGGFSVCFCSPNFIPDYIQSSFSLSIWEVAYKSLPYDTPSPWDSFCY